jgi:streptogramin lyase
MIGVERRWKRMAASLLDRSLASLAVTADGEVWGMAGEQGVARFDGEEWTWYDAVEGRSLGAASALVVAPASSAGTRTTVWVAGGGALFRFENEAWTVYELPQPVAEVVVEEMAVAADGVVWFATSRGALKFEPDDE